MRSLIRHVFARTARRTRAGTTFCEDCGTVCTPLCRLEARRDEARTQVYAATVYRP
jgi:hypothetical protein